jgi:hypothetical protein
MMAPKERNIPQHLKNIMKIDVREIKIVNFSLRKGNVLIWVTCNVSIIQDMLIAINLSYKRKK